MTRCKWLSLLLLLLSLSGTCWIASTSGVASSTPMMQRRKQSQMYKNFFFFFSNILLYFFQERERERGRSGCGGEWGKPTWINWLKQGIWLFFSFLLYFAIGPSSNCLVFRLFFSLFIFWLVEIETSRLDKQIASEWRRRHIVERDSPDQSSTVIRS